MNIIHQILFNDNITGSPKLVITSFAITCMILLSVILIGAVMNAFENLQINFLEKHIGRTFAMLVCTRLTFVGTIVHEYSHALFGVLTGAKINKICCFQIMKQGQLGYVKFQTRGCKLARMMQLTFVGCAPVVMGCIIEYGLIRWLFIAPNIISLKILIWYLIISIANHMSMSGQDIKNYCKGLFIIAPLTFGVLILLQLR